MRLKHIVLSTLALFSSIALSTFPLSAEDAPDKAPKPYPLETCLVSDEKLGGMGDPYVFVHEGQEIKMCCEYCKPKFDKEPAKYLKKLEGK